MAELDRSKLRLFFAAVPDVASGNDIAAAGAALAIGSAARLVPRNNHHMTLAFIGEVPAIQLERVRAVGAAQRGAPFSVQFDAYEYWPKPEVIVAAARSVPAAMQTLWQRLHGDLAECGWALTPKRLRPHVTLAKNVAQDPVLPLLAAFEWPVREFSLMRSDLGPTEAAYTEVDTWPLLDNGANA